MEGESALEQFLYKMKLYFFNLKMFFSDVGNLHESNKVRLERIGKTLSEIQVEKLSVYFFIVILI